MTLPITILKNVLDFKCMHIEKAETATIKMNAVRCQANSSKSEATNTTIKGLIKLARGFHNIENLIALVYLKCSDLIVPLCNRPTPSKEYLARQRKRANELRRLREEQRRKETAA